MGVLRDARITRSRAYYLALRDRGTGHQAALRQLAETKRVEDTSAHGRTDGDQDRPTTPQSVPFLKGRLEIFAHVLDANAACLSSANPSRSDYTARQSFPLRRRPPPVS
jgi:hypothetical protein